MVYQWICTDEALRLQHNVDGLISYVENTLIRRYNNFCANDIFEQNCGVSTDENYRQVGNNAIDKQRNDKTISKHKDPMITHDFKEITDSDSCLYQYYLHTPKVESGRGKTNIYRITFLHRSFYQYFLSEFFYEKLKSVTDDKSGEDFLKDLWPRHVDPYVLDNLRLLAKDREIDCIQVLKSIGETDAVLSDHEN